MTPEDLEQLVASLRGVRLGNIRDLAKFIMSLPDWSMFSGCFGNEIKPTDIDGCVERNGRCFFVEHKLPNASMNRGQLRLFEVLAAQGNTVVTFWSAARDGTDLTHMMVHRQGAEAIKETAGLTDLRAVASEWYRLANEPSQLVEASRRRDLRSTIMRCVGCANRKVRLWAVSEKPGVHPAHTLWWCADCEPWDGKPVTDWRIAPEAAA